MTLIQGQGHVTIYQCNSSHRLHFRLKKDWMVLLQRVSGALIQNLIVSSSHCDLDLVWSWTKVKVIFNHVLQVPATFYIWSKFYQFTMNDAWDISEGPFFNFKVIMRLWPLFKVTFICTIIQALSHTLYDSSIIILLWIAYEKLGKGFFFDIFKVNLWLWPCFASSKVKVIFQYTARKVSSHTTFDPGFITLLWMVYEKWGKVHFFTFSRSSCDLELGSRSYSNTP